MQWWQTLQGTNPRGTIAPLALHNQLSCQWNELGPLQGAYQQYPLVLLPTTRCRSLHRSVSQSFLERKIWLRCCPPGLFGDAIKNMAQQFSAVQEQTEVIRHILPRQAAAYSCTLCQTVEPGKRCTAHSDPSSVHPQTGSLRSTSLPHRGHVGGPAGSAYKVSGAWLPKPSRWLLQSIRLGYAIQFARRPPKFSGIHFTSSVLRAEIAVLLAKDAIEPVPPADMKTGFYSPYIIVPKKGGGLQPVVDEVHKSST